ncbi:MAG TPA: DUF4340 domain-containing protein [Steroidobacteraceae bacterium]|nr:DUF4340 domain-containing protein [Steroidobacteraceae bacterium]
MTARRVAVLFGIGILIIALAAWVSSRSQTGEDSIAGTAVLPGLEGSLNEVTRIRITKAGNAEVTLERHASDWVVGERGYPADSGKLRKLLLDLGSLKAVERKTRLARNYPVLGVQDVTQPKATGARIDVVSPGRTWSLIVGNSMDGSDCYVRVVDSPQSLLVRPLVQVDADPKLWLDPTVLDIGQGRVSEIREQPAKGAPFSISRDKKTQTDFTVHGIPRGRELTGADAADSMASALSSLTLTDVRKAAAPPKASELSRAVFRTFDGLEIDVSGYKEDKDDYIDVAAKASDKAAETEAREINTRVQGWEYEIPDYRYGEIFQSIDGLLKPLPVKPAKKARADHRARKP